MDVSRDYLILLVPLLFCQAAAHVVNGDDCAPFTTIQNTGVVDGGHLLSQVNASAVSDCCLACTQIQGCAGFTFNPKKLTCRMSEAQYLSSHSVEGVTSGKMAPAPPPPPPFPDYCTKSTSTCRNVLYLLADDMRADWGTYGLPVVTPHFDALAKKSIIMEHAFCQISVCAPSRMSFMTGRRPDTFGVWNFIDTVPMNTSATPGHFKDYNYITLGLGKTFHQDNGAWNAEKYWNLEDKPYFPYAVGHCPHGGQGGGHCVQTDDEIYDYHLMLQTQEYLQYAANKSKATGRPFCVMAGFRKPHAPWQYPQRMWDLYNESEIPIAQHKVLPTATPLIAWTHALSVQLENGTGFPYSYDQPVPDWVMRDQRHAYYSSISYVDENVGKILATLDETGMQNNTVIIFHADHGYHMGEHGEWEKKSNFDLVVRVPLMIHVPWMPQSWGKRSTALFDLVNVFPTVAALAGLPVPVGVDGEDLSALVSNPDKATGPTAAFHQYPACGCSASPSVCFNSTRDACNNTPRQEFNFMGYSMRTTTWRYTIWVVWNNVTLTPEWDGAFAEELYDHTGDDSFEMDKFENANLASTNQATVLTLRAQLKSFFQQHEVNTASLRLHQPHVSTNVADVSSDPYDI